MNSTDGQNLSFEEILGLTVDRESLERENRRLTARLRNAKLKMSASIEDIDFRHPRGLEKQEILSLASCRWIKEHLNIIITGPTGVGKTYLACALGHKACLTGHTTLHKRASNFFSEIAVAKGDGSYPKFIKALIKTDLLIIDDFGLECLNKTQALDLLELLEDRYDQKSTLVTAQVPVDQWHGLIGDPTLADAAPGPAGPQRLQDKPERRVYEKKTSGVEKQQIKNGIMKNPASLPENRWPLSAEYAVWVGQRIITVPRASQYSIWS